MKGIIFSLGFGKHFYIAIILGIGLLLTAWFSYNQLPIGLQGYSFLAAILGIFFPFTILRRIKCPQCKFKLFWEYFNNSKKLPKDYSPFSSEKCPTCGYNP